MPRDPSTAETTPSTSYVNASATWRADDQAWQLVLVNAEVTDPNEVGLFIRIGDNGDTYYFDPTAAAILGSQLIEASRAATAKTHPGR
jgi:hypothetical protein